MERVLHVVQGFGELLLPLVGKGVRHAVVPDETLLVGDLAPLRKRLNVNEVAGGLRKGRVGRRCAFEGCVVCARGKGVLEDFDERGGDTLLGENSHRGPALRDQICHLV